MAEDNSSPLDPSSHEKLNSRRFSADPSSSSNSVPNYLRASTGSCHDFCKYGHSSKPKARTPFPRRPIKRPVENEILVRSEVFPEGIKNSPVNRPKSSSAAQVPVTEASASITRKAPKSDVRKSSRVDHGEETNVKKPARGGTSKLSQNSATSSLNAKKPMKKDVLTTNVAVKKVVPANGTSRKIIPTKETSKQVVSTSEALRRSIPSPKGRRLSVSLVLPVKSASPNFKRLSASTNSSLSQQRRDEIKARESNRHYTGVASKIPRVSSSASSSSRASSTGAKVAAKKVLRVSSASRMSNGASIRKNTNKGKNVEAAKVCNKKVAGKTSCPVKVEETKRGSSEVAANESLEAVVTNSEEFKTRPYDTVSDETIAETKFPESVTHESIADSIFEYVEEAENKSLGPEETESKSSEPEKTVSKYMEPVITDENISENSMEHVEETESSQSWVPVTQVIVAESVSPSIPGSLTLSPVDSPCPRSMQGGDRTESEYSVTESEEYSCSEYEESDLALSGEISEGSEGKNRIKKGRGLLPEHEEGSKPVKLRFRRGRIIDVQHDSDTVRRLRFRRGRTLDDAESVTFESRRKRRERIEAASNDGRSQEGSTKVVLRHSDIQEKKDTAGLLNNVIEETATKLVESRKSKVKALVGAFETVISLHDTKPSANT